MNTGLRSFDFRGEYIQSSFKNLYKLLSCKHSVWILVIRVIVK